MKKEKIVNNNGITLLALVITIIILLILASITVYSGMGTVRFSKYTSFKTEMKLLQAKVDGFYSLKKEEFDSNGIEMTQEQREIFNVSEVSNILLSKQKDLETLEKDFKYYSKDVLNNLGIEGITGNYFININERIIISSEPFTYDGVNYYMLEQIDDGGYNVSYSKNLGKVTFDASSSIVDGEKGIIKLSNIKSENYVEKWQIRYREKGQQNWIVTNEFFGNSYDIDVDKICDYEIQIFHGNEIESDIVTISVGKPEQPSDSELTEIQKNNGVIEIMFLKGTGYGVTNIPNEPILKDNMKAVYWDETGKEITDSDFDKARWYDYVAQTSGTENGGTSQWANAKVTVDGIDSYFVWIPRYAYRIVYFDTEENENLYRNSSSQDESTSQGITGYSDARGIVDSNGKRPLNVDTKLAISVNEKYFMPHSAFEGDTSKGGWSENITGMWVAKYESSKNVNQKPVSIPNVGNWKDLTISEMYILAENYNGELNSHLTKNSEWGAVAYLSESKYGRNGTELAINNSSSYITGNSEGSSNATAQSGVTYPYNTQQGGLASTTGNIYGVYDMSGNSWEYVANYYNKSEEEDLYTTNAGALVNDDRTSNEYVTVYDNIELSRGYLPGDATYETSGWNNNYAQFYNSKFPFLSRGGFYKGYSDDGAEISGLFAFGPSQGYSYNGDTFRMTLIVTDSYN